ncbi:MAG: hypothetical protein J6V57_04525 [Spirochaetaceae bacterium]|nr:hypothetical protein [Spirochaetaceae bacterium]
MKQKILVLVVFFIAMVAYGQDASKVTEILEAPQLTTGHVAYVAACWIDTTNETVDFQQATKLMISQGLLKEGAQSNDPIRLDELAGLCMKAWNIPGGLLYRITKADRYAFKELKALNYFSANADPAFSVTGSQGMDILFKCMEYNTSAFATE